MSFYINGYLGEQINEVIAENYKKYNQFFQLCEDMNRYFIEITRKIKLEQDDIRGVLICCLLTKILNACQGIVIMSKYGLDIEAQTITRTALESLFYLSAIACNEEFFKEFIKSDIIEKEKIKKKIKKNPQFFSEQNLFELDENSEHEKIKDYNTAQVAEVAGMQGDYCTAYTYLCSITHPDLMNLFNRYTIKNDNLTTFNLQPSTNDIELVLYSVCYIILKTLLCLDNYFKISIEKDLDIYEKQILKIFKAE